MSPNCQQAGIGETIFTRVEKPGTKNMWVGGKQKIGFETFIMSMSRLFACWLDMKLYTFGGSHLESEFIWQKVIWKKVRKIAKIDPIKRGKNDFSVVFLGHNFFWIIW